MIRKVWQFGATSCGCLFFLVYLAFPVNATLIPPQEVDNQLIKLVNECVLAVRNNKTWPNYCMKISLNRESNYTVLNPKDGLGKLLLLPNNNIHGVEDTRLFEQFTPSYFYLAWENRYLIEKKLKRNLGYTVHLKSQDYVFSLNAVQSRTQDRLHIHMTCINKDYQKKFQNYNNLKEYSFNWRELPFTIQNPYTRQPINFIARKITLTDIKKNRIHKIIKEEVGDRYPNFGIAVWPITDVEFLLAITDDSILAAPGKILSDSNCSKYLR